METFTHGLLKKAEIPIKLDFLRINYGINLRVKKKIDGNISNFLKLQHS